MAFLACPLAEAALTSLVVTDASPSHIPRALREEVILSLVSSLETPDFGLTTVL